MPPDSRRLPSLDGWRALSIGIVLGAHTTFIAGMPPRLYHLFSALFDGHLGVRMFFIISGFLITWLMLAEFDRSQHVSLTRFYIRRGLRIFPVYFAFLFVLLVLQWLTPFRQSSDSWLSNLTFTTNFNSKVSFTSSHLWSLAVEEQFYLCWPCMFAIFGCGKNTRIALLILMMPMLVAPVARAIAYLETSPKGLEFMFLQHSSLIFFDSLSTGCICAFLWARIPARILDIGGRKPWAILAVAAALVAIPQAMRNIPALGLLKVPFSSTLQNVGMGLLLLQSVAYPKFAAYPVLNLRPVMLVGVLSYSIYIWQNIFCSPPSLFGLGRVWWMSYAFWTIPAVLVASLSYYAFELPLLRLRARFRG